MATSQMPLVESRRQAMPAMTDGEAAEHRRADADHDRARAPQPVRSTAGCVRRPPSQWHDVAGQQQADDRADRDAEDEEADLRAPRCARWSRMPGMRGSRSAAPSPLSAKITKIALRQAVAWAGRVGVVDDAVMVVRCRVWRNRIDSIESFRLRYRPMDPSTQTRTPDPRRRRGARRRLGVDRVARVQRARARSPTPRASGCSPPPPSSTTPGPTRPPDRCVGAARASIGVVTEDRLADAFRDPINLALLDGHRRGARRRAARPARASRRSGDGGVDLAAAPMDAAILLGCSTDVAQSVEALRRRRIPVVAIEARADAGRGRHRPRQPRRHAPRRRASARPRAPARRRRHPARSTARARAAR